LSGGEIAAMALLDAVARLQPGVLNDAQSHQQDSFGSQLDGLLDCQHYTRPQSWGGTPVPQVLMSGKHAEIERWRREQSLALTARDQRRVSNFSMRVSLKRASDQPKVAASAALPAVTPAPAAEKPVQPASSAAKI
jgi:tRNA (guanine37-N1)-methyltransferase